MMALKQLTDLETVSLELKNQVLRVTLNRPEKRNAMNAKMVSELREVFDELESDRAVRAIVIRGAGGHFCAGADISGMNLDSREGGRDASWAFNRSFGHLIEQVNRAPQVVICVLEGAVLGGGYGLACVCDLGIAHPNAVFAMPETGLGIIPAQISPFVVARIGLTQARRYSLLGEKIVAERAVELGIAHILSDRIEEEIETAIEHVRRCAPNATAVTKHLILDMAEKQGLTDLLDRASDDFAAALVSEEGQEGTRAFIEKRKPVWSVKPSTEGEQ